MFFSARSTTGAPRLLRPPRLGSGSTTSVLVLGDGPGAVGSARWLANTLTPVDGYVVGFNGGTGTLSIEGDGAGGVHHAMSLEVGLNGGSGQVTVDNATVDVLDVFLENGQLTLDRGFLVTFQFAQVDTGRITLRSGELEMGDPASSLQLGSASTVEFLIGGTAAVDDYGQIDGSAASVDSQGGRLEIEFVDGFVPSLGDTFELISGHEGDFGAVDIRGVPEGFEFMLDVASPGDLLTLHTIAVPEPGGLLIWGGLALLAYPRRTAAG